MNRRSVITPEFVEFIPSDLQEGVVYISEEYSTSTHLCMCGCGNEVVNPLSPEQWRLTRDGDNVTLYPSIGNWSFACQSHYWIRDNKVDWARQMSKEAIAKTRRDRAVSIRASQKQSFIKRIMAASRRLWTLLRGRR